MGVDRMTRTGKIMWAITTLLVVGAGACSSSSRQRDVALLDSADAVRWTGKGGTGQIHPTPVCDGASCAVEGEVCTPAPCERKIACKEPYLANGEHPGRNGALTAQERKMLKIAWKYFQNNYQETTGLVNAVNDYPSTTLWDTASYLGGLVTAYENCIVDKEEFDRRMVTILKTFNGMDFYRGEVPNKVYHTQTGKKVNYGNEEGEIGFSALDLGRLLIWLKIIKERYPQHSNAIDRFVLRWNFCHMIDPCGTMYGAYLDQEKNETVYVQEGRLGYEEYAAKGFQLWGFDTTRASKPEPYETIPIYGVDVPYDVRDPRRLTAHNYVVCESYVLDGMELNWDLVQDTKKDDMYHSDTITADFAQRIYMTQVMRYKTKGILTARTEHQLDGPPYFVYDTIYTDGYAWNTITETGEYVPDYAAIALKGALGLWAVWATDYTDLLFKTISGLYDLEKGFYEGLYENGKGRINTFTANNNGIMMEALLYKTQGKLLRLSGRESLWDKVIADEFQDQSKCYPLFRGRCKARRS